VTDYCLNIGISKRKKIRYSESEYESEGMCGISLFKENVTWYACSLKEEKYGMALSIEPDAWVLGYSRARGSVADSKKRKRKRSLTQRAV
jgi:hypothetical protein